jgi:hypothetical protein
MGNSRGPRIRVFLGDVARGRGSVDLMLLSGGLSVSSAAPDLEPVGVVTVVLVDEHDEAV